MITGADGRGMIKRAAVLTAWRSGRSALLLLTLASAAAMPFGAVAAQGSEGSVAVTLRTAMGDINLELYADRAPITVANFLAYLNAGHYNGGSFYRVVRYDNDNGDPKIEVIQSGVNHGGRGAFPPIAHESTEEITLFKSLGLAVEDLVLAHYVLERAWAEGVGVSVPLPLGGLHH